MSFSPNLIAVIQTVAGLLGIIVTSYTALRVASLNNKVKEVHTAVNSERTALLAKFDDLLSKYNLLLGANNQRQETNSTAGASAIAFEAGRQEGQAGQKDAATNVATAKLNDVQATLELIDVPGQRPAK
jgi:hypothetical protein